MPLPLTETTMEKPVTEASQDTKAAVRQVSAIAAGEAGKSAGASSGSSAAQDTRSSVEKAADKLYEERIEDEYAKREGGA